MPDILPPRSPRTVPDYRDALEFMHLRSAVRLRDAAAGDARAVGALLRENADTLRDAELFYVTRDFVDTAKMLEADAPSLPVPEFRPRFALFEVPYETTGGSVLDYQSDGTLESERESFSVVGISTMSKPSREWNEAAFAPDFYGALTTAHGDDRLIEDNVSAAMLLAPNREHSIARLIFWLIDNPDLMTRRDIDAAPKLSKAARRRGKPHEPSPVTIVDLCAPHRKAAAEVATAERMYRSRWIVRGHWHHFWTGKAGERVLEPRYVMPYVKGPAGAPLNVTEKIGLVRPEPPA